MKGCKECSQQYGWREAAQRATPLAMGYLPVGVAFGVLAHKAGLSTFNIVLMSVLVYAGSAQLIAVSMFAAGLPLFSIVVTTFIVNLRHLLMSAALAPYLHSWRPWQMGGFAAGMTDETFAVHSVRFSAGDTNMGLSFRINILAHGMWVLASLGGALVGGAIPNVKPLGMDFALPAMFIALLAMQAKNGLHWLVAGFSGLASVALLMAGAEQWSVLLATVLGATLGVGVKVWAKQ